jgi:hypothetical protein
LEAVGTDSCVIDVQGNHLKSAVANYHSEAAGTMMFMFKLYDSDNVHYYVDAMVP